VIENMELAKGVRLRGEASFVNRRFPGFRMLVGFEQESAKTFLCVIIIGEVNLNERY